MFSSRGFSWIENDLPYLISYRLPALSWYWKVTSLTVFHSGVEKPAAAMSNVVTEGLSTPERGLSPELLFTPMSTVIPATNEGGAAKALPLPRMYCQVRLVRLPSASTCAVGRMTTSRA